MTKKDFELIARALKDAHPHDPCLDAPNEAWEVIAESMADALATTNPRFDRARFLAACGGQS